MLVSKPVVATTSDRDRVYGFHPPPEVRADKAEPQKSRCGLFPESTHSTKFLMTAIDELVRTGVLQFTELAFEY